MSSPFQSFLHGRKRHRDNTQLRLRHFPKFHNMSVQMTCGPLITNYLEKTYRVMKQARDAHSRILAVPLDLRYPEALPASSLTSHNTVISRFLYFLSCELTLIKTTHDPDMRYIWCREQDTSDKPHYHALLFFNGNALRRLGTLSAYMDGSDEAYDGDCLYHRLVRAWAWAINWPLEKMGGLVNVTQDRLTDKSAVRYFHRGDRAAFREVFYAASYLCKAYSKPIGQGVHCFDGSRL
ncbi:inovirus-type Gp2 protein [Halomonas sp. Bachu 37]|uniref:YagK/YfjJ domain-containing protein n=1 Tax=Halomonas kashgarensis TaxID=3084920 RepID=UPI0032166AD4